MAGLLIGIWVLAAVIPVVIYLDATKHRIGKIAREKSGPYTNRRPSDYAFWSMFIPLATFLYVRRRRQFIQQAAASPVDVSGPHRLAVALSIVLLGTFIAFAQAIKLGILS